MAKTSPPTFFATPNEFGKWLAKNHDSARELWVGFHKRDSGRPSMTWPESVDEALCFGWIDGLRKALDSSSYIIRFTPRKTSSVWSEKNIGRVDVLTKEGRIMPAGLAAFAQRKEAKSGIYAYEQRTKAALEPAGEKQFRANRKAWAFFQTQPPWYRRTALWKVTSAKRPETRQKRLEALIADSADGLRIKELRRLSA